MVGNGWLLKQALKSSELFIWFVDVLLQELGFLLMQRMKMLFMRVAIWLSGLRKVKLGNKNSLHFFLAISDGEIGLNYKKIRLIENKSLPKKQFLNLSLYKMVLLHLYCRNDNKIFCSVS